MRTRRACDACRQRKIQCDSNTAASTAGRCDWCSNHGKACTFYGLKERKRAKGTKCSSLNDDISRRHAEDALAQGHHWGPSMQSAPTTSCSSPACPLGGVLSFYAECRLGYNCGHSGIPFLTEECEKLVNLRTGEECGFRKLTSLHEGQRVLRPALSQLHNQGTTINEFHSLPKKSVVKESLDVFHKSAFRLAFPVIDNALFQESITVAYDAWEETPSQKHKTAKACVLAFLSMIGIFHNHLPFLPPADWDAYVSRGDSLLLHIVNEASLETLQTAVMLHLVQTFSGCLEAGAMYHAFACRLVLTLGGHINRDSKPFGSKLTRRERETRQVRLLFWHCYIFDKDIALRTGQPPLLLDDYCDLTPPQGYVEICSIAPSSGGDIYSPFFANESLVPFLPGEVRLSRLKDKVYRLLYSVQALAKPDAEMIGTIIELDNELEAWRLSIPKTFRPSLLITEAEHPMPDLKLPQRTQHIVLQLEYHYLMVIIHRASVRGFANVPDGVDDAKEHKPGIHSSMALCLEASRSTLFYLRAAIHGLAGEVFWLIVFYPMEATMTLFLHILAEPLAAKAKMDLELLSSAAGLICSMPVRKLTPYAIGHIQLVNDFVIELVRLGNCAISIASSREH